MAKTVDQLTVKGKRVLMRVDFNVPQDDSGAITDDRRIRMALPSIRNVLERGGRAILMSHLGRPSGDPADAKTYSLAPVAKRLGELLGQAVTLAPGCTGPAVRKAVDALKDGKAILLENLRLAGSEVESKKKDKKTGEVKLVKKWTSFEEQGAADMAKGIAELGELYVNDAFGTCHRDHVSMVGVPALLGADKCAAGFLVRKEVEYLQEKLAKPAKPFVMIMGGAKVSDKIGVIENLLDKVDVLLIGGAMSYTFMKAAGVPTGNSLVETDKLDLANHIREKAKTAGVRLELPVDFVVGDDLKNPTATSVAVGRIPDGKEGFDIGPATAKKYAEVLKSAKTIVWNGPVGVFETPAYREGTRVVAEAVAAATDAGAVSVIGGGDSASAMEVVGVDQRLSHISTGGGASLELLEGKQFNSLKVLG
ncbi:MAG: Bifunctional PGK/TIM [Phycisphaerae bacterium]|nr:Bifunctional PGK/TIM [Phycisphaerae bacterium]